MRGRLWKEIAIVLDPKREELAKPPAVEDIVKIHSRVIGDFYKSRLHSGWLPDYLAAHTAFGGGAALKMNAGKSRALSIEIHGKAKTRLVNHGASLEISGEAIPWIEADGFAEYLPRRTSGITSGETKSINTNVANMARQSTPVLTTSTIQNYPVEGSGAPQNQGKVGIPPADEGNPGGDG